MSKLREEVQQITELIRLPAAESDISHLKIFVGVVVSHTKKRAKLKFKSNKNVYR